MNKIWEKHESKKGFAMKSGELIFDFSLHYQISQYGKVKLQTKNRVSKAYAT